MSYELYPKKMAHSAFGSGSMSGGPGGTKYPGRALPCTTDGTGTVKCDKQHGNGASAPGSTYPKREWHKKFGNLSGLPS